MLIQYLFSFICITGLFSAFLMILTIQPIIRLALIIKIFVKSAFILIILDYYFLGLTFIIVYVGAIAILFLFVIKMAEVHKERLNKKEIKIDYFISNNNILFNKNLVLRLPLNLESLNNKTLNNKTLNNNNLINYLISLIFILTIFTLVLYLNYNSSNYNSTLDIWNFFTISYSSEFISFTDIQSLGFILFLGYPIIIVYLGMILWIVLIGILRISK